MIGSATSARETNAVSSRVRLTSAGQWLFLGALALVLACACVIQFIKYPDPSVIHRDLMLQEYLPNTPSGWRSEDRPLGETEALSGKVKKLLDYDEALFRIYHKQDREFAVYLAYWRPGKMSSREIAFHIPDKCWVAAGWRRVSADYHYQKAFEGSLLAPAQARVFEAGAIRQQVIYWHIFNGQAIIYNPDGSPSDLSVLEDIWRRGLRQKGEQYFIRVSTTGSMEELWSDEGFQEVMEQLVKLGPALHPNIEHFESPARLSHQS